MAIIDEEGRLFGVVNVVDALVLLLVFAVALAGISLVVSSDAPTGQVETRYVTVDFGTQPEFLAERFGIGDTSPLENEVGNLTITDTYLTRGESGIRAIARVAVTGRVTEGQFTVGGEPLRFGRIILFETDTYAINGTITDIGNETTLPTQERSVVLRGTVPDDIARSAEAGDEIRVGGETVVAIRDVAVYDAENPDRRTLYVVADLQTLADGETTRFAGTRVEVGRTLSLPVAGYQFNATIERVGGGLDRRTNQVLVTSVVDSDTARAMSAGDTYTIAGQTVATIENVTAYDTDNPDRKRVYVGLSVRTLGYGQQPRFGARLLREGSTIPFQTGTYDFSGNVIQTGTSNLQLTTKEVLVTSVVDVGVADRIEEGDAYTVAGQPVATVESLAVYGTDDPDRKRVYVGLSVRTLGFGGIPRFGADRPLRKGVTLPLRTESYEFGGEIVRLGTLTQPGETTQRVVTLQMQNVPPERADSVEVGLTETNAGQTIARVMDVRVKPAVITLTSESGNIYEREHPVNKDVTLTVELRVRELDSGIRFKGRTLQEGNEVILDLGTTTIRATVVDLSGR